MTIREYQEKTGNSVHSTPNQEILRKFVDQEVIYCISSLVYELVQNFSFEVFPEYEEDLLNSFIGNPDYEESANQEGWQEAESGIFYQEKEEQYYLEVKDSGVKLYRMFEPEEIEKENIEWEYPKKKIITYDDDGDIEEEIDLTDPEELAPYLTNEDILPIDAEEIFDDPKCDFEINDTATDWEDLCDDEGIDTENYRAEIFEHWIISDFLARKLEDKNEKIMRDFFGMTVWGRSCTGQAILLDSVIAEIALEMEILKGQRYEWRVR